MAAESEQPAVPRGKAKKKSALAKLVDRKKRQVEPVSDADNEIGSRLSFQAHNSAIANQSANSVPLEPQVVVERKLSAVTSCVSCRSEQTSDIQDDPDSSPNRDSTAVAPNSNKMLWSAAENSAQGDDLNDPQASSRSAPTDSTVYRFRNMRMAVDQPENTGSKLQGPFVPKPPTTPRSARSTVIKAEKRNHEPASSGDEPEVGPKRQSPGISDIEEVGPKRQSPGISDIEEVGRKRQSPDINGIEEIDSKRQSPGISGIEEIDSKRQSPGISGTEEIDPKKRSLGISGTEEISRNTSAIEEIAAEVTENHKLSSEIITSPAKSSIDTQGTEDPANDTIEQLHNHYRHLVEANSSKGSPMHVSGSSLVSLPRDSAFTMPRSTKLAPLEVKSIPPPLDTNLTSHNLRTAYKTGQSYHSSILPLHKPVSSASSVRHDSPRRLSSDNLSVSSAGILRAITTKEARSRNFLVGSVSSGSVSVTGLDELERYFPDHRVHTYVGSWNMNELKGLSVSINDFILPEACEYLQDIYAVGTQENQLNKKDWEIQVQEALGPSHVLFHSFSYGSLHLAVFIRRDLIWFCSVPEDDVVSLRAFSMVKTKGAIGICFSMFGTSFLFLNCHLTSDRGVTKNKHRLLDYHRITQQLHLPRPDSGKPPSSAAKKPDVTARFDCVFWCGDLNFRLEQQRTAVEKKVLLMAEVEGVPHYEELLGADQLSNSVMEGKIFEGFQEGRINFQPTYKFDLNKDTYDTSVKNRIPSYTDRILFRSRKKNHISCIHYDAVMSIKPSDHRPVYASFEAILRPGRDNIQLCAGQFNREVYLEGNKRRAQSQLAIGPKNSRICVVH